MGHLKSFIAGLLESAREEGRSHGCEWGFNSGVGEGRRLERREIEAVVEWIANQTMDLCENSEKFKQEVLSRLTSRESSEGGKI